MEIGILARWLSLALGTLLLATKLGFAPASLTLGVTLITGLTGLVMMCLNTQATPRGGVSNIRVSVSYQGQIGFVLMLVATPATIIASYL